MMRSNSCLFALVLSLSLVLIDKREAAQKLRATDLYVLTIDHVKPTLTRQFLLAAQCAHVSFLLRPPS